MPQEDGKVKLNLTDPPYPALFLKAFGNDGRLPYKIKCFALAVSIWVVGFVHAYVMNVLDLYVRDIPYLLLSILLGITYIVLMHVCKQTDSTLRELDKIFGRSENEFKEFIGKWNRQPPLFYYLCLVISAVSVLALSLLQFFPVTYEYVGKSPWLRAFIESGTVSPLTYSYVSLSNILLGIMIGIGLYKVVNIARIIDDYGDKFIKNSKRIDIRRAILPQELTSLAKLAIKIDIIVAVPTTISVWIFLHDLFTNGIVNYGILVYLMGSILVFVLCSAYLLRRLHHEMEKAKEELIGKLDRDIQQVTQQIGQGIQGISLFHDLVVVRDQVKRMSTWGVNTGLLIRFFMTGLLPLVTGALLQIWIEILLFP